jgi:hypothetical protein
MPYLSRVKTNEIWLKHGKSLPLKMNFLVLGSLDNSKFLEIFILLPFFKHEFFPLVDKKTSIWSGWKKLHKKASDEEKTNGQKCKESASTHNETKTIFVPK